MKVDSLDNGKRYVWLEFKFKFGGVFCFVWFYDYNVASLIMYGRIQAMKLLWKRLLS